MAGEGSSMSQKRHLEDHDPDYEDVTEQETKRQKLIEQDAKETAVRKIESIVKKQFTQEIHNKEQEVLLIDERLHEARRMLDRLRACIVASYYTKAGKAGQSSHSQKPAPSQSVSIHPAIKQHLGKTVTQVPPGGQEEKTGGAESGDKQQSAEAGEVVENTAPQLQADVKSRAQAPCTRVECGSRFKVKKRIIVGNVSRYIPVDKRDERDHATHKWMVYVRGPKDEADISYFVKKVWFFLHPSYKPNDLVEIAEAPFHLTRRGWGEFPVRIQLHFTDSRNKRVDIIHHLKLVDVELDRDSLDPKVERLEHPLVSSDRQQSVTSPTATYPELAKHLTISHHSSPVKLHGESGTAEHVKTNLESQFRAVESQGGSTPQRNGKRKADSAFTEPVAMVQIREAGSTEKWTHLQIKTEVTSPQKNVTSRPRVTSPAQTLTPRSTSFQAEDSAVVRPQGLPIISSGADSLISGGIPRACWSSLEIKSEPTSPERPQVTSPARSILDDGYHSTSLPSTPERPPSASSFVKIEQGASPKLRINVGETHNLPSMSATGTGTTLQIGSIGGTKSVNVGSVQQVAPPTKSPGQTVYVKCMDSKGKIYLIPQHALMKTSTSTTQGAAVQNVSQNILKSQAGSGAISQKVPQQSAIMASTTAKPQQKLVMVKQGGAGSSLTQSAVIGSGPNSATLTYMLAPVSTASTSAQATPVATPGKSAVSLLGVSPDSQIHSRTSVSTSSQLHPSAKVVTPQKPILSNPNLTTVLANAGKANSKPAPMQLLIPGPGGTLQLVQTLPVPSAATRSVSPAGVNALGGISPGRSLLRKQSPGVMVASPLTPRSVTPQPGSRPTTPSSRSSTPGPVVLLQSVGSPPRIISPPAHSTKQAAPVVLLAGNLQNLPQPNSTTRQTGGQKATGTGVSLLKNLKTVTPPSVGESPNGPTASSEQSSSTNHSAQGATHKIPPPQVIIKVEQRTAPPPPLSPPPPPPPPPPHTQTVAQLLKSRTEAHPEPTSGANSAEKTGSLPRVSITLPKPSKRQENQLRTDQQGEPVCHVNLDNCPDLESLVKCLVRQHPLVNEHADRSVHPYCARSVEDFLKWNVGKRRAAEWQRASRVRDAILTLLDGATSYGDEDVWSKLRIVRWCRWHCFSPWDTESSKQLCVQERSHPVDPSGTYSSNGELMTSLRERLADRTGDEEVEPDVDIISLDSATDERVPKLNSPAKEEGMVEIFPSSTEGEFVRETAAKIGVRLKPVQLNSEDQGSHNVFSAVLEDMLWAASKSFMEDLLRKSMALLYQDNRLVEDLSACDIYRSIQHMPLCDFLTGAYLGVPTEDGTAGHLA